MVSDMDTLTIGKVARRSGVGVETVRFYERKGLIEQPPRPASSGFRTYSEATVRRIRFIRQAQDLGFSLREAGELLDLNADPSADAALVRAHAATKLAQIEDRMRRLGRIRGALEALIDACPGGGALHGCSIVEALGEPRPGGDGRYPQHEEERT